jgi:hypothetical protein
MKKLKTLSLFIFILCVIFAESFAQETGIPKACTLSSPDIVIPWDQEVATGVINITYSDYTGYDALGIGEAWVDDHNLGNWNYQYPTQIPFGVSTSGICTTKVKLNWGILTPVDNLGGWAGTWYYGTVNVTKLVGISGPESYTTPRKNSGTITVSWTMNMVGGIAPYQYTWYREVAGAFYPTGTGKTLTETHQYEGIDRSPVVYRIKAQITDAAGKIASGIKTITHYYPVTLDPFAKKNISGEIPDNFLLSQNYPNPFNPSTIISFQLPTASNVNLKIFDVLGKEVAMLAEGMRDAGYYTATFNGLTLPSGIYFARFNVTPQDGSQPFNKTIKMLLVK